MFGDSQVIYIATTAIVCVVAFFIFLKGVKMMGREKTIADKKLDIAYHSKTEAATSDATGDYRVINGYEVRLNPEAQDNYMPGRTGYEEARNKGNFRSIIFRDANGLQRLLDEKAGTGDFVTPNKERVNFGVPIGQYMDPVTNSKVETTVGVIHYTTEGAYIVPARPSSRG